MGGGVGGYWRNTRGSSSAYPMSIKLIGKGDKLGLYANNITAIKGYTDVIMHGSKDAFWVNHNGKDIKLNQRSLSKYILKSGEYNGGAVRLISCSTGGISNGAAQHLSNKLGQK